jgi:hypothetical protein
MRTPASQQRNQFRQSAAAIPGVSTAGWTRRAWIKTAVAGRLMSRVFSQTEGATSGTRRFHVCLSPAVVDTGAGLLELVRDAGVTCVWLADFFYGHEPFSVDLVQSARRKLERLGLQAQLISVPLGHPGDSLGAKAGDFPLTPPLHWKLGRRPDGRTFAGTSLHAPATLENEAALKRMRSAGFRRGFVDDDFRLARGPGEIGGCFCDHHRERFLREAGFAPQRWDELLDDVRNRRLTSLLRRWISFTCDELTSSFQAQQQAFDGELGIMVMYLGAEKAGIRLADYRQVPVRVGELMFDDSSFGPVKGKTDEVFSALFHRRFVAPERAYSETTAFPADRLSAANMAAKLVVSTLADVRQTMFMSGLSPFPREHWRTLGPAMQRQSALHRELAGHVPRGPFKHFWGEAERWAGDDRPFSLWLALGVPFEVVDRPSRDGWTFLADFDARELATSVGQESDRWVCRPSAGINSTRFTVLQESLPELFAFKRRLRERLRSVPHVVEDEPAVCAWYPTAGKALVWNLSEQSKKLTILDNAQEHGVSLGPLEAASVPVNG